MTAPASLYVDVAGGAWEERREHTVRSEHGALVLAIMSGGTQPLP